MLDSCQSQIFLELSMGTSTGKILSLKLTAVLGGGAFEPPYRRGKEAEGLTSQPTPRRAEPKHGLAGTLLTVLPELPMWSFSTSALSGTGSSTELGSHVEIQTT